MGKIAERFVNWMKGKYEKKGLSWDRSDNVIWCFWGYVFPFLAFIPLLFFLLKKLMIDYLLAKKGFETTIIYIAIILIIRPLIMEAITRIAFFKKEIEK